MRCGFWLFSILAANLAGNPGTAAEFAVADPSNDPPFIRESPRSGDPINAARTPLPWRLVRGAGTNGEPGASAILHTVEFGRSDPRIAGLMLRCGKQNLEIIVVVVEPFPPHAHPQVTLSTPEHESRFVGTIIPTGAGIRLPSDAAGLVTNQWVRARELDIKVTDGDTMIDGVIAMSGLSEALDSLNAECVQK